MTAVTDVRGRCASCEAEVFLNAPHICNAASRAAMPLADACEEVGRLKAQAAQLEAERDFHKREFLSLSVQAANRVSDLLARIDELKTGPQAQQATAWAAVWEQLKKGNDDFAIGRTGLDAAVAEVKRLQRAAEGVEEYVRGRDFNKIAVMTSERDTAIAACERAEAERDALKVEASGFGRRLNDMAKEHAREQNSHAGTRRELDAWVGHYKDLSARHKDNLRDARRYRYLRTSGSEWARLFSQLTGDFGGCNHARLSSRYVDEAFDEKVDVGLRQYGADKWTSDGGRSAGAVPAGPSEVRKFLVPIEVVVPPGFDVKMTDFHTLQLTSRPHERGCCCAECRQKVM